MKKLMFITLALLFVGCASFTPPSDFTKSEKIQYTTIQTLKSAKAFREFTLESAGAVYKKGLMDDDTRDKIIEIGDRLQQAINVAADALLAYRQSGETYSLEEKLSIYQAVFNEFMEIVTPYAMEVM